MRFTFVSCLVSLFRWMRSLWLVLYAVRVRWVIKFVYEL